MTTREEQQECLILSQGRLINDNMETTTSDGAPSRHCSLDLDGKFDDRVVAWATLCIKQFLQPRQSLVVVDLTKKGGINSNNDNSYTIPELDALLITMKERIQCALMNGLKGRRLLRNIVK
jgi:hypothetical protein